VVSCATGLDFATGFGLGLATGFGLGLATRSGPGPATGFGNELATGDGDGVTATGDGDGELADTARITAQNATRVPVSTHFVRIDHFVRQMRMLSVIGKKAIAARITSQRGNPPDVLGEADIGGTDTGELGEGGATGAWVGGGGETGAWLAGNHWVPSHHHWRSSENRGSRPDPVSVTETS
jgi:hypothetical protein